MFSRVSPSRRCDSSCATSPCISSRVSWSSAPCVTAMIASCASQPAANALMASARASTVTCGDGQCAAMHISSTMLHSCCSARELPGLASRAPTLSANLRPPWRSWSSSIQQPPSTSSSVMPIFTAVKPTGYFQPPKAIVPSHQASVSPRCTDATTASTHRPNASNSQRVLRRASCCRSQKRMT